MSAKPSVIYLTTPTSATASMWRILTVMSSDKFKLNRFTDSFYQTGNLQGLEQSTPPPLNNLILFNVPHHFPMSINLKDYCFALNVRDPRDLLCNMYHWKKVHTEPGLSDGDLVSRKIQLEEDGIDKFVLSKDISSFYSNIIQLDEVVDCEKKYYLTYSLLCTDFEGFLRRAGELLCVDIGALTEEQNQLLDLERPNNLRENVNWIGNQWSGSDLMPGRYLKELSASTIDALNVKYKNEIDFCMKVGN